jgi:hypothetical protein
LRCKDRFNIAGEADIASSLWLKQEFDSTSVHLSGGKCAGTIAKESGYAAATKKNLAKIGVSVK